MKIYLMNKLIALRNYVIEWVNFWNREIKGTPLELPLVVVALVCGTIGVIIFFVVLFRITL